MILTAQQPQYFPNYYYLYKIFQGDVFLFADHLKYRKQTLTNRAFISDNKEQKPLILPVIKNTPGPTAIKSVTIDMHSPWIEKHLRTLEQNFKYEPYFEYYFEQLKIIFDNYSARLSDFLWELLQWHCKILLPGKKLYRSSSEGISSTGDLKKWAKDQGVTILKYYDEEEIYYQKNFKQDLQIERLKKPAIAGNAGTGYKAEMAIIVALFHHGPAARQLFK